MGHLCILYFHLSESHSRVQRGTRTDAALIGWLQSQLHRCDYTHTCAHIHSLTHALSLFKLKKRERQKGNTTQGEDGEKEENI